MDSQLQQLVHQINCDSFAYLHDSDVEEIRERAHNPSIYKPSGPRDSEEGVSDEKQGILSAQLTEDGLCCVLKITMLAAGFVVGPKGVSIRSLCDVTGAKSISWCSSYGKGQLEKPFAIRICLIKGSALAIHSTIIVICKAVARYQALVSGNYNDEAVRAEQFIDGVSFMYKPPPSKAMPQSARITARKHRKSKKMTPRNKGYSMVQYYPHLEDTQGSQNLSLGSECPSSPFGPSERDPDSSSSESLEFPFSGHQYPSSEVTGYPIFPSTTTLYSSPIIYPSNLYPHNIIYVAPPNALPPYSTPCTLPFPSYQVYPSMY
eukprot:TRINITY_DN3701_c0_g1_i12.p1 TRINITY_DN3701_c0_g1~~TRINITY_DN3701_c0_g1_i12.p1  ORF type:complete len:319 (-),score=12.47 TRINITY_DN3701_c0_g1_i12:2306-3262(-)